MKRVYLAALLSLLPLAATSAFACGGEDEEACDDSSVEVSSPNDMEPNGMASVVSKSGVYYRLPDLCVKYEDSPYCQHAIKDIRLKIKQQHTTDDADTGVVKQDARTAADEREDDTAATKAHRH